MLAATRGIPGRGWWVSLGILLGVLGAGVVAVFAGAISNAFAGSGQELLNAAVLIIAVDQPDLAQCLDGRARPRVGGRDPQSRHRCQRRPQAADRAHSRGVHRGDARRLGDRAVPLRHRGRRHRHDFTADRRRARSRRRRGADRAQLLRPDLAPDALHLLGDQRADRAAGRRHGGAGGALPAGRRRRSPRFASRSGIPLGCCPLEHRRPHASRPGRLHRQADRAPARRLSRHACDHVHPDPHGADRPAARDQPHSQAAATVACRSCASPRFAPTPASHARRRHSKTGHRADRQGHPRRRPGGARPRHHAGRKRQARGPGRAEALARRAPPFHRKRHQGRHQRRARRRQIDPDRPARA